MSNFTLDLSSIVNLNREEFRKLCAANSKMKLERTSLGELIVMAPTGGETGSWNSDLNGELYLWNRQSQSGKTFDSSTGFELPQGSDRSPDAAWVRIDRWSALSAEERRGFLPLCPDFVLELLSPTDSWQQTQKKMEEYRDNGCRLGWLIDPKSKRVAIYRPDLPVEILTAPDTLAGENVLVGFVLDLRFIWSS